MIVTLDKWALVQLAPHFWSWEFRCRCRSAQCTTMQYDTDLLAYLERKRSELAKHLGAEKPLVIHSGYRCAAHNRRIGGVPDSQHCLGRAADVWMPGERMMALAFLFEDADGLGRYPRRNFLHVDVRGHKTRWTK